MSIETFTGLLDDLPTVRRVTLQGLGEPLLAPDLETMIAEAVRRGIEVGFNTNGTLLTRDRSERLVAAGLHWLHVSIDGARPETFAAIRKGGRLATVVANLRELIAVRSAADRHTPHVQLNTVVMRRNLEELPDIVRLAADIGVDRLWIQGLSHDFDDVDDDAQFVTIRRWASSQRLAIEDVEPHFDAVVALAAELGLELRLPGRGDIPRREADEPACDWPWRSLYVNHDGTVQPCCMLMGSTRGRQGDVNDQPIGAIWNNTTYRRLREGLLSVDPPDICRGCSAYRHTF